MTKLWFKNYPKNVAHQIDLPSNHSLVDLFHQTINQYQDKIAFSYFDVDMSFNELDHLSASFAAYLQYKLKIKKGDHVALMCPNLLCFPVAMWGIFRVGAVQVNVNPMYTARELQHQLNDAQVDTIIIFSSSTKVLADIIDQTMVKNIICVFFDDLINKNLPNNSVDQRLKHVEYFTDTLKQGEKLTLIEPELCQADLLFLQYTGGTTGLSKGAMLSHGNILANILQYQEFGKNHINYGNELVLTAIPMYHIFALTVNALCYFAFGAKNVLVSNPKDLPALINVWKNNQVTFFTGVNTLFNGLLHTPGFSKVNFSQLKLSIGGGAAVQQAVANKWFEVTGNPLKEGYGLSETSPVLTLNFGNNENYQSGIGIPLPSTNISIRDDLGNILATGESGELCVKGPQVMSGYWNNKKETDAVMTDDGFFKTGDIAVLDEQGSFHIVDRKKDMIIVSGFNVYPNEIESELANMTGIVESACIGIDDEKTGEAVKVFVVKDRQEINEQQVMDFCRKNLSAYKIPKQVSFIDEIPKSAVGKILRRDLR